MSADDPELRRLLALYREERAPTASAHERVWSAVASEVAPNEGAPDAGDTSEPPAAHALPAPWLAKAVIVAALLAAGGAAWVLWPTSPAKPSGSVSARALPANAPLASGTAKATRTTKATTTRTTSTLEGRASSEPMPGTVTTVVPSPAQPAETRAARAARVPSSTLALELALLTKAQSAIDGHDYARALRALRRHAGRFPNGALAEEREAASVEVLCGLGRAREARHAAEAFRARFPDSPRVTRVSASCATEPAP